MGRRHGGRAHAAARGAAAACPRAPARARAPSPGAAARLAARAAARGALRAALAERAVKARLAIVADAFNRSPERGLERLAAAGLAPSPPTPHDAAALLRHCPAVSRDAAGDLLGDADEFAVATLDAFAHTFDFRGTTFDGALRAFLAAFRLPGEAQKISRVMEAFGARFHAAHPSLFVNADAAYVLAYSAIMLHTDAHNAQVKKKMTADEFVRNNRGINGGADLPSDFLQTLYASIVAVPLAVAMPGEGGGGAGSAGGLTPSASGGDVAAAATPTVRARHAPPPPGLWARLADEARAPRGVRVDARGARCRAVDAAALRAVWAPAVAALATALDGATGRAAAPAAAAAVDGLLLLARVAAHHRVDEAVDAVAACLAGHAVAPLDAAAAIGTLPATAAAAFGADDRARAAAEALFGVAARYGDSLRAGWRSLVDALLRLHGAGLVPADALGSGDPLPPPRPRRGGNAGGSLFSRALSSLISVDPLAGGGGAGGLPPLPPGAEAAATAAAVVTVDACRVGDVVADSKFLKAEALADLAAAVAAAGAAELEAAGADARDAVGAEVCVELVLGLAARNRDRLALAWPPVHALVAAALAAGDGRGGAAPPLAPPPVVARAVAGTLRTAASLLAAGPRPADGTTGAQPPPDAAAADAILRTVGLLTRLPPPHAWELAPALATGAAALAAAGPAVSRRGRAARALLSLLCGAALHPHAGATAVDGILAAASPEALSLAAYPHVIVAVAAVAEGRAKGAPAASAERAAASLERAATWLVTTHAVPPGDAAAAATAAATATASPMRPGVGTGVPPPPPPPPRRAPDADADDADPSPSDCWTATVAAACRLAADGSLSPAARDGAVAALAVCVGGADALALPPSVALAPIADGVAPAVARLAACARGGGRDPGAGRAAATAARAMVKGVLAGLPRGAPPDSTSPPPPASPAFAAAWDAALAALATAARSGAPDLEDAAPEAAKNALLVAAAAGALAPGWTTVDGATDLWAHTWRRAAAVSADLTPAVLAGAAAATVTGPGVEGVEGGVAVAGGAVVAPAPVGGQADAVPAAGPPAPTSPLSTASD